MGGRLDALFEVPGLKGWCRSETYTICFNIWAQVKATYAQELMARGDSKGSQFSLANSSCLDPP